MSAIICGDCGNDRFVRTICVRESHDCKLERAALDLIDVSAWIGKPTYDERDDGVGPEYWCAACGSAIA